MLCIVCEGIAWDIFMGISLAGTFASLSKQFQLVIDGVIMAFRYEPASTRGSRKRAAPREEEKRTKNHYLHCIEIIGGEAATSFLSLSKLDYNSLHRSSDERVVWWYGALGSSPLVGKRIQFRDPVVMTRWQGMALAKRGAACSFGPLAADRGVCVVWQRLH